VTRWGLACATDGAQATWFATREEAERLALCAGALRLLDELGGPGLRVAWPAATPTDPPPDEFAARHAGHSLALCDDADLREPLGDLETDPAAAQRGYRRAFRELGPLVKAVDEVLAALSPASIARARDAWGSAGANRVMVAVEALALAAAQLPDDPNRPTEDD
jgi:hypothetical protein